MDKLHKFKKLYARLKNKVGAAKIKEAPEYSEHKVAAFISNTCMGLYSAPNCSEEYGYNLYWLHEALEYINNYLDTTYDVSDAILYWINVLLSHIHCPEECAIQNFNLTSGR